jgi:hypothetical protein
VGCLLAAAALAAPDAVTPAALVPARPAALPAAPSSAASDSVVYVPERVRRRFRVGVAASFQRLPAARVRKAVPADFDTRGVTALDDGSLHVGTFFGGYLRRDFGPPGHRIRPLLGVGVDPLFSAGQPPVSLRQNGDGEWELFGRRTMQSQISRGVVPFAAVDVEAMRLTGLRRVLTLGLAACLRRVETALPATPEALAAGAHPHRTVRASILLVHLTVGLLLTEDAQLLLGTDGEGLSLTLAGDWNWWAKWDAERERERAEAVPR